MSGQRSRSSGAKRRAPPLGKYPETVTYTLGKVAGANNANLPVGDTYEDNAYTRYLKNVLNIQNENVFALEADGSYEKALEAAISDRDIPDVMVVNGRDNLIRLVESGLVEDLTDVMNSVRQIRSKKCMTATESLCWDRRHLTESSMRSRTP